MGWESVADYNAGQGVIRVPIAGQPIQVVIPTLALKNRQVHAVLIQQLPKNTGKITVGRTNSVRGNGIGNDPSGSVMACLPPPTANVYQSVNAGVPLSPASLDLINIWVDVDVNNEGFILSFVDM